MIKGLLPVLPLVLLSVIFADIQCAFADDGLSRRWVYVQTNLQVTENADRLEQILWRAKVAGYNDEIRVANWSADDQRSGKSAGQLLADNVKRSIEIIRKQSPKAQVCVWSHMFDPHHNARDKYYLVRGDLRDVMRELPEIELTPEQEWE